MNKELQDLAWRVLPAEFREDVKILYTDALDASNSPHDPDDRKWGNYRVTLLEKLFGHHNLTSDAEGEEMLCCERSKVQSYYQEALELIEKGERNNYLNDKLVGIGQKNVLYALFDSKCLPDNVDSLSQNPTENCDTQSHISTDCDKADEPKKSRCEKCGVPNSSICAHLNCQDYVSHTEPKPTEPKFKVGDKVKDISSPHDDGIYKIDDIKKSSDGFIYHIQGLIGKSNVKESDLEPCTEPTANYNPFSVGDEVMFAEGDDNNFYTVEGIEGNNIIIDGGDVYHSDCFVLASISKVESRNLSQETANCDKQFDNILKDSFRDHNRLHIAAMAMQGMLSNTTRFSSYEISDLVRISLNCADALIAESEKGG